VGQNSEILVLVQVLSIISHPSPFPQERVSALDKSISNQPESFAIAKVNFEVSTPNVAEAVIISFPKVIRSK
jgi:hypothetical protein